MKKKIILLCSLMLVLICSNLVNASDNRHSDEDILKFALEFITTVYSDFSDKSGDLENFVDKDSYLLREFIADRYEIMELQSNFSGRKYFPLEFKVVDSNVNILNDKQSEVLLTIDHNYISGDLKSFMQVKYKIIIANNFPLRILAAMSNDISASKLFDSNHSKYEELNLEYQLNSITRSDSMDKNAKPYDKENQIKSMKNLFEDINSKQIPITLPLYRAGNFRYFTTTQKNLMRTYQDNYYNSFNPNYYNFENIPYQYDCTNYTSQVLAQACPLYDSNMSGLRGLPYWYYRSLANRSYSWAGVNEFRQYVVNNVTKGPTGYLVNTFGELGTGSIIQLWSNDIQTWRHNLIVYTQGGDPWVTAHSSFFSGYASDKNLNNCQRIRIDGYYE